MRAIEYERFNTHKEVRLKVSEWAENYILHKAHNALCFTPYIVFRNSKTDNEKWAC
jgi:hypothetical protein